MRHHHLSWSKREGVRARRVCYCYCFAYFTSCYSISSPFLMTSLFCNNPPSFLTMTKSLGLSLDLLCTLPRAMQQATFIRSMLSFHLSLHTANEMSFLILKFGATEIQHPTQNTKPRSTLYVGCSLPKLLFLSIADRTTPASHDDDLLEEVYSSSIIIIIAAINTAVDMHCIQRSSPLSSIQIISSHQIYRH